MRPETAAVHAGSRVDPHTGGLNTPIYTSSAYEYIDQETRRYPRYFNTPNQEAVVRKLCALEGAEDGLVFSSGMAATTTALLSFVRAGDHAVIQDEVYGGSHAFVEEHLRRFGVDCTFAGRAAADFRAALTSRTRVLFVETPTNPLLNLVDLRAAAAVGREAGLVTVIDNTFATPVNQRPIELGIDVVVHSGTKYLGGHSDLCCGAAVARAELVREMRRTAVNFGGNLDAEACYRLERSMKTLALRVGRQSENALALARFLHGHPRVGRVRYPGLEDHPDYAVARGQMNGYGAMLSFEVRDLPARAFLKRLRLIRPALSLGGVESTACDPATTSHQKVSAEVRERLGITDRLVRLSVGIEHVDDLREDLDRSLAGER